MLAWQIDQFVFSGKDESRGIHLFFGANQPDAALQTPAEPSLSVQKLIETLAAVDEKFLEIQVQAASVPAFISLPTLCVISLPTLCDKIDLKKLMLQYIFLDIGVFAASRDEEVAKSQLFHRSALEPGTDFQLELEPGSENGEV